MFFCKSEIKDLTVSEGTTKYKTLSKWNTSGTIESKANYGGIAYVYDGYIEMQSNGALATDEYMTILVKFPLGTFNGSNKLGNNFEYYYNMAEEGSSKYIATDLEDSSGEIIAADLVSVLFWGVPMFIAIEVKLFEEYLILAQMMGIAKKVAKQFKNLYPEIIYTSYDYILLCTQVLTEEYQRQIQLNQELKTIRLVAEDFLLQVEDGGFR